jgi:hypothetical protein
MLIMDRITDITSLVERMKIRIAGIEEWLEEIDSHCQAEQRHTIEGTIEREYWHYGYMVAFMDLLDLIERDLKPSN